MHELSIAMSLLDVAQEELERRGGVHVRALHLKLGALSGVVKEALLSAYSLAREGTPLTDCRIVIQEIPVTVWCAKCESERAVESIQRLCCGVCGEPTPKVLHGRELELSALEIDE